MQWRRTDPRDLIVTKYDHLWLLDDLHDCHIAAGYSALACAVLQYRRSPTLPVYLDDDLRLRRR